MKKMFAILFVAIAAMSIIACNNTQQASTDQTEIPVIAIKDFDSVAGNYVGKEIIIQGTVSHICKHGGKKMFLFTPPDEDWTVKVTTENSFGKEIEGSDIKITGKVAEVRITAEEVAEMEKSAVEGEVTCKEDKDKSTEGNESKEEKTISMEQVEYYKELLEEAGGKYISFFSVECTKYELVK